MGPRHADRLDVVMDESELAAAHDANFVACIGLLAQVADAGFTRSFGRVRVAVTRAPSAFFNAVFVTEQLVGRDDDLRNAVDLMRGEGLPFTVHVRADLSAEVAAARSLGLVGDDLLPCYAIEPGPIPAPPTKLEMGRVDAATFGLFLDTMVVGFGLPRDLAVALFRPRILDVPGVRGYLGTVAGRPVATAMSVRTGDTVGIYSIATVPDARGRGYGTAMTWITLNDVDPGVRIGILQASLMGRPVYERMGFRLVREYLELSEG